MPVVSPLFKNWLSIANSLEHFWLPSRNESGEITKEFEVFLSLVQASKKNVEWLEDLDGTITECMPPKNCVFIIPRVGAPYIVFFGLIDH